MLINKAIEFVLENVDKPAILNPFLEKEYKAKVKRSVTLIRNFKKVGDLYLYMLRFAERPALGEDKLYDRFTELGLKTYEDIVLEFENNFKNELNDITTVGDFIIGETYSAWDISIFARNYDVQSGIYLIGEKPKYSAIFLKCNLDNGDYANTWLEEGTKLKYYLYGRTDKNTGKKAYNVEHAYNKALIESKTKKIPLYVFIKIKENSYKLNGVFYYNGLHIEPDDSKWSELIKINSLDISSIITKEEYYEQLADDVEKSFLLSDSDRQKRLESADKIPKKIRTSSTQFQRNPDVIAHVLKEARGHCQECQNKAPFIRKSKGTPYLEVHHITPLSEGGEDTVGNSKALCPNCHRKAHFG